MNFDANEILRQATRVREEVDDFNKDCNQMIIALHSTANIIKSEDSDLSERCNAFANSYIRYQVDIKNKFIKLATIMEDYAKQSLKNQEELSQELNELDNAVQDINSTISTISDSAPEIYVDFD